MKKICKKKKIILSFLTAIICVLVIVILISALSSGKKEPDPARTDDTTDTETEITVDTVTPESVEPEETDDETEEISDDGSLLTLEEPEVEEPDNGNVLQGDAGTPASPSEESTPPDDGNGGGGISIGGGSTEPYNCGAANHHCDGPETHAFIQNLEIEGCPFCGSHSCPSFYATDAWGYTCYTPSVCPSYDIHRDPVYYCQECGKPCGDGKNGTCVQFVNDCNCPNCGEAVSAWTCHSCK